MRRSIMLVALLLIVSYIVISQEENIQQGDAEEMIRGALRNSTPEEYLQSLKSIQDEFNNNLNSNDAFQFQSIDAGLWGEYLQSISKLTNSITDNPSYIVSRIPSGFPVEINQNIERLATSSSSSPWINFTPHCRYIPYSGVNFQPEFEPVPPGEINCEDVCKLCEECNKKKDR